MTARQRFDYEDMELRAAARRAQNADDESREAHAAFLAHEKAEGYVLDAMSDEDQVHYLKMDEDAQHALVAARMAQTRTMAVAA
jgi:hypothetical protein